MGKVFGNTDVAHDSREPGDEPSRLDLPDCIDSAMGICSRHSYPSHHLQHRRRKQRNPARCPTSSDDSFSLTAGGVCGQSGTLLTGFKDLADLALTITGHEKEVFSQLDRLFL